MKVLLKPEHIKQIFDAHYNRFVDDISEYYQSLSWPRMSERPLIWSIKEWLPSFYMTTINPDNESEGYVFACIDKTLLPCGEVDWEKMHELILKHYVIKITTTDIQFRYDFENHPGVHYDKDLRDMLFKIYCDLVNGNCHLLREAEYQEYLQKEKDKTLKEDNKNGAENDNR
jgi:hypothetical protein